VAEVIPISPLTRGSSLFLFSLARSVPVRPCLSLLCRGPEAFANLFFPAQYLWGEFLLHGPPLGAGSFFSWLPLVRFGCRSPFLITDGRFLLPPLHMLSVLILPGFLLFPTFGTQTRMSFLYVSPPSCFRPLQRVAGPS